MRDFATKLESVFMEGKHEWYALYMKQWIEDWIILEFRQVISIIDWLCKIIVQNNFYWKMCELNFKFWLPVGIVIAYFIKKSSLIKKKIISVYFRHSPFIDLALTHFAFLLLQIFSAIANLVQLKTLSGHPLFCISEHVTRHGFQNVCDISNKFCEVSTHCFSITLSSEKYSRSSNLCDKRYDHDW